MISMNDQFSHLTNSMTQKVLRPKAIGALALGALSVMAVYNAAFGQTGAHPATIIAMRDDSQARHQLTGDEMALPAGQTAARGVTRIVFANPENGEKQDQAEQIKPLPAPTVATRPIEELAAAQAPAIDTIAELQALLAQLGFYDDDIDGKPGPKTQAAIENYKVSAGLQGIELSTGQLVTSARNNLMVTAAIPVARPDTAVVQPKKVETVVFKAPGSDQAAQTIGEIAPPAARPEAPVASSLDDIKRVQAGLRKFAGEHIVVDGIFGGQTRDAISEFQSVFRLNVTGAIDQELLNMMQEVGLFDS
jgi:peptidoglycan hydrolase-like protein with peptidoglycan-binding domain